MAERIMIVDDEQANLELLERDVFFLSYTPLFIKGLDSCPVRVYAVEGLAEFS